MHVDEIQRDYRRHHPGANHITRW